MIVPWTIAFHQIPEPADLLLEILEPPGLIDLQVTVASPPVVVRRLADAQLPADLLDDPAGSVLGLSERLLRRWPRAGYSTIVSSVVQRIPVFDGICR